jgi:benzylsuccinate CoA-transferase BbsE subunit
MSLNLPNPTALEGIRVLEIPGQLGAYAGKLFADMGADVILIEPKSGATTRRALPLIEGVDPYSGDASLDFAYFNTSKRSITLDLDTHTGQEAFKKLAKTANLIIDSSRPGFMKARGLDHNSLASLVPELVYTSITPFGQTGPYAEYESEDIVLLALGGLLSLAGFIDSPPTRVWGNQAVLAAAQFAAAGSLAAVLHADISGEGQLVDVAAQQCVVMGLENAVQFADLEGTVRKRAGGAVRFAGTGIFSCLDGEVFVMAAGVGDPRFWQNTVAWLRDEGVTAVEEISDDKWRDFRFLATDPAKEVFRRIFTPFAETKTLKYLYHEGQRRGVPIAPMSAPSDLVTNDQLNSHNYFVSIDHPKISHDVKMPGAPYLLSATPVVITRSPRAGEHTKDVLSEVGFSISEIAELVVEKSR